MKKLFVIMALSAVLFAMSYGLYLIFSLLVGIGPWCAVGGLYVVIVAVFCAIFHDRRKKEPKAQAHGSDEITPDDVAAMLHRIQQEDATEHRKTRD